MVPTDGHLNSLQHHGSSSSSGLAHQFSHPTVTLDWKLQFKRSKVPVIVSQRTLRTARNKDILQPEEQISNPRVFFFLFLVMKSQAVT